MVENRHIENGEEERLSDGTLERDNSETPSQEGAWVSLNKSSPSSESLQDSQWVTFGSRVTFTFAFGDDVGSVHFDRSRGEIFFKGHNIRNLELEEWQWQILEKMRNVLTSHPKLRNFINPYSRLLEKIVLEKSKKSKR
ncbi:MAG: hypothetical protein IPJ69_11325 [Deltaproteobacteria bacterium]|nr:MAG: hypothetical protein IPJ69_11325 [Deltaproteobacteria bacterium]